MNTGLFAPFECAPYLLATQGTHSHVVIELKGEVFELFPMAAGYRGLTGYDKMLSEDWWNLFMSLAEMETEIATTDLQEAIEETENSQNDVVLEMDGPGIPLTAMDCFVYAACAPEPLLLDPVATQILRCNPGGDFNLWTAAAQILLKHEDRFAKVGIPTLSMVDLLLRGAAFEERQSGEVSKATHLLLARALSFNQTVLVEGLNKDTAECYAAALSVGLGTEDDWRRFLASFRARPYDRPPIQFRHGLSLTGEQDVVNEMQRLGFQPEARIADGLGTVTVAAPPKPSPTEPLATEASPLRRSITESLDEAMTRYESRANQDSVSQPKEPNDLFGIVCSDDDDDNDSATSH